MTNTQDYSLEYWEYTVGTSDFKGDKWFYALETTINHIDSEENVSCLIIRTSLVHQVIKNYRKR